MILGMSQTALHVLIRDVGLTYKMLQKAAAERDEEAQQLLQKWQDFIRDHLVTTMIITIARMATLFSKDMVF